MSMIVSAKRCNVVTSKYILLKFPNVLYKHIIYMHGKKINEIIIGFFFIFDICQGTN